MLNFFNPKKIAVIGASNHKEKVGYSLMDNLRDFKGKVFPVNVYEKKILGKRAYKNVLDIKEKIDLAVIAIPSRFVKDVLVECGKKRIENAIIISAGFSEIGNNEEESNLLRIAKGYGIRLLGANCFGVVNPYINLDTTFARSKVRKGSIAFVSQSGALWSAISDYSLKEDFGFSGFASLGNMIDVGFTELINHFNEDKNTKVIMLYMESLKNGVEFMNVARKSKKPIIVIKAGMSEAGVKAALSHTGSLAGTYLIYKSAFKQSGVILAETLTEGFDIARFLIMQKKPRGNKIIIVTNAGGSSILAADYCEKNGLDVVKLDNKFVKSLNLPSAWSHNNPIDVIGDARSDRYKEVFDKLDRKNFFDIVLVLVTPQKMTEIMKTAEEIVKFKERSDKSVITCFMGGDLVLEAKKYLKKNKVLCFFEPERAARLLGKIAMFK